MFFSDQCSIFPSQCAARFLLVSFLLASLGGATISLTVTVAAASTETMAQVSLYAAATQLEVEAPLALGTFVLNVDTPKRTSFTPTLPWINANIIDTSFARGDLFLMYIPVSVYMDISTWFYANMTTNVIEKSVEMDAPNFIGSVRCDAIPHKTSTSALDVRCFGFSLWEDGSEQEKQHLQRTQRYVRGERYLAPVNALVEVFPEKGTVREIVSLHAYEGFTWDSAIFDAPTMRYYGVFVVPPPSSALVAGTRLRGQDADLDPEPSDQVLVTIDVEKRKILHSVPVGRYFMGPFCVHPKLGLLQLDFGGVFRVDPATGKTTLVSEFPLGGAPALLSTACTDSYIASIMFPGNSTTVAVAFDVSDASKPFPTTLNVTLPYTIANLTPILPRV